MNPLQFGEALLAEYWVNQSHVIEILTTCYGGPANWSSISWTAPNNSGSWNGTIGIPKVGDNAPDTRGDEVLGMTVFWVLFCLCLSCVVHPLVSSVHDASQFCRHLHVSPLWCLFDAVYLIFQCFHIRKLHPMTWKHAAKVVVLYRLGNEPPVSAAPSEQSDGSGQSGSIELSARDVPDQDNTASLSLDIGTVVTPRSDNMDSEVQGADRNSGLEQGGNGMSPETGAHPEVDEPESRPSGNAGDIEAGSSRHLDSGRIRRLSLVLSDFTKASLNIHIRLIAGALNVLLYAKWSGFEGIRTWSTVGDLLFVSWLIMETILLVGYHAASKTHLGSDEHIYVAYLDQYVWRIGCSYSRYTIALLPLMVELGISTQVLLFRCGYFAITANSCLKVWGWLFEGPVYYLLDRPLDWVTDGPRPVLIPAVLLFVVLLPVYLILFFGCVLVSLLMFLAIPIVYGLVLVFGLWCFRKLSTSSFSLFQLSAQKMLIIWARVHVTLICAQYLAYFLWLYDPQGTSKSSWTELLGKRLG